jgi:multimeric flavodoxin WrbA
MEQPKVSVIYHGTADGIQALVKEVATGAEEVGAVVRVRRVPDHATPDDVHWADAVVLGSRRLLVGAAAEGGQAPLAS